MGPVPWELMCPETTHEVCIGPWNKGSSEQKVPRGSSSLCPHSSEEETEPKRREFSHPGSHSKQWLLIHYARIYPTPIYAKIWAGTGDTTGNKVGTALSLWQSSCDWWVSSRLHFRLTQGSLRKIPMPGPHAQRFRLAWCGVQVWVFLNKFSK